MQEGHLWARGGLAKGSRFFVLVLRQICQVSKCVALSCHGSAPSGERDGCSAVNTAQESGLWPVTARVLEEGQVLLKCTPTLVHRARLGNEKPHQAGIQTRREGSIP